MCKCDRSIKTPFCMMGDCVPPKSSAQLQSLPVYQSHKKVRAGEILFMAKDEASGVLYLHLDRITNIVQVNIGYLSKHNPEVGGYYVLYEDGYESYSPASAFNSGYIHVGDGSTAVGSNGAVYHNPEQTYLAAEEAECVGMALDNADIPINDAGGAPLSLWGRVCKFRSAGSAKVKEEDLERLYWEFDAARSKQGDERLRFKETLRGLVRSIGCDVE